MIRLVRLGWLLLFIASIALAEVPSHPHRDNTTLWNLRDADIHSVIAEVAKVTGKNFIVDPRVQGKVTIISATPLTKDEVYPVFLSLLRVNGYAAIPDGHTIKILPMINALQENTPVGNTHLQPKDAMVVKVIAVKNKSAEQLVPVLRPLIPPSSSLSAYLPSNSLIVSDTAANIAKITHLVHEVDTANQSGVDIVPLQNALASDVVKELVTMMNMASPGMPQLALAADDRTNSIIMSGNITQRARARLLIQQLDAINSNGGSGNTQVVYLHYQTAKNLVPILAGIAQASFGEDATLNTHTQKITDTSEKNKPEQESMNASISAKGKHVEIESDPSTNSLIISAPNNVMRTLRSVINRLDLRPAQVLVEAAIVEIDETKLKHLGIQWGTSKLPGDTNPVLSSDPEFSQLTGGLGVGFIHNGDMRAMITALARDGSTNILSTPDIIVLDNQTADIKVGKKVPFITGSYSTAADGSLNNPYTTTQREYVGLELKVTPQINQGNAVKLLIQQGNESIVDGSSSNQNPNPITDESDIKTSVIVNNGEILVLGGLMSNQMVEILHKLPILGDIPGVGLLFRDKEHDMEKKDLMVFLRPVILRNDNQNINVTDGKYDYIRTRQLQQLDQFGYPLNYGGQPSILPPLHGQAQLPSPFVRMPIHGDGIN
ncbi:MAG: type II secretion system secretin GspD [Legionellales bacterium]|nr:type II secretion system secretin GspD [Legionellales bacterium]